MAAAVGHPARRPMLPAEPRQFRNSYLSFLVPTPAMPKPELLPGVTTAECPPRIVCDAHNAIRRARRRAVLRDGLQVALIIAVDYLFVHWPESRVPFLDRASSLTFLRGVNAFIVADLWLSRAVPKWQARRIASTWCRSERAKFRD